MIRYSLVCEHEHEFDSWFDSSAAYDRLAKSGLVECPHCGSNRVHKALMAPNIAPHRGEANRVQPTVAAGAERLEATVQMGPADPKLLQLRAEAMRIARAIREHVTRHADYVGPEFAAEARRIHFGEVEPHGIYGEATADEVSDLAAEGIEIHPLPRLPEDSN